MPIEIIQEEHPHVRVIRLRGRLDTAGAPALQGSLQDLRAQGVRHAIIDCSQLQYVSSVGLGIFVTLAKSLGAAGGKLCFAALNPHVTSVFEMVGFLRIFPSYPSVEEALSSPDLRPEP